VLWYGAAIMGAGLVHRLPEPAPMSSRKVKKTARAPYALSLMLGGALLLAAALVWLVALTPPDRRLSVTVMDVGQGEAILIEDPEGHRILVDGGPSPSAIEAALGRRLPFYDRRIDLIVLTHPQADHLGGLPAVMDRYKVGAVMAPATSVDSELYRVWQAALAESSAQHIEARRGQHIRLAGGGLLTVLAPGPWPAPEMINDSSVVIRLDYGDASFLLTADMGQEGEERLLKAGTDLHASVLKVGHHGSRTSTSAAFVRRVQPEVGIISVGEDNPFGHPAPEVLQRLAGKLVLRTDVNGDITVSTDGRKLWVNSQRAPDDP
jgi:competence protein ComEC